MKSKEKGSSLYFTVVILAVVSGIVFGTSSLLISQIKVVQGIGNSVGAFYMADTGIEHALENIRKNINYDNISETEVDFGGGVKGKYSVVVTPATSLFCDAVNYCVKSIGEYQGSKRAIEIKF
jgi:hypothetical protein